MSTTNIPTSFPWLILFTIGTIVAILIAGAATRGNVWAALVAGGFVQILGLTPGINVIPWWSVMFYVVVSVAIIMLYKGRSVGI